MTEPNDNDPPKRGTGTWGPDSRWPEEKERSAEFDADVVRLRRQRTEFAEIGRLMALKYRDDDPERPFTRQSMHARWKKAIAAVPAKEVNAHRAELNEQLDELLDRVNEVLRRDHVLVSNGRLMRIGEPFINEHGEAEISEGQGEPLRDDGPIIAAAAEMRKLIGEIRQLNGLTVPVKQELGVDATVSYTINGVDVGKLT